MVFGLFVLIWVLLGSFLWLLWSGCGVVFLVCLGWFWFAPWLSALLWFVFPGLWLMVNSVVVCIFFCVCYVF